VFCNVAVGISGLFVTMWPLKKHSLPLLKLDTLQSLLHFSLHVY